MASVSTDPQRRLETVNALACELGRGNQSEAERLLGELTGLHESAMFQEMGQLTRKLHDSMSGFQLDSRMSDIAEGELSDAKARLDYVVSKTEESAHRTLDAAETIVPLSDGLHKRAQRMRQRWLTEQANGEHVNELPALLGDLQEFVDSTQADAGRISTSVTDVMLAQEYQDLTGQVLRQVIGLVQEVEDGMVAMLRLRQAAQPDSGAAEKTKRDLHVNGPQIDAASRSDVAANQDDVDELLSSFGF